MASSNKLPPLPGSGDYKKARLQNLVETYGAPTVAAETNAFVAAGAELRSKTEARLATGMDPEAVLRMYQNQLGALTTSFPAADPEVVGNVADTITPLFKGMQYANPLSPDAQEALKIDERITAEAHKLQQEIIRGLGKGSYPGAMIDYAKEAYLGLARKHPKAGEAALDTAWRIISGPAYEAAQTRAAQVQ